MQPVSTTTIRRPFHWGIVIVADADSRESLPDVNPQQPVTGNDVGVIALVRHAQDVESFEGDYDFAEAEVTVRLLSAADKTDMCSRREIYRGRLVAAKGRLSVGDADEDVVISAHQGPNDVVVTVDGNVSEGDLSPEAIRVDLLPALWPN